MGFRVEGKLAKIYDDYVNTHPGCKILTPEVIWLQMRKEGKITQEQYNAVKNGLIFDYQSQKSNDGDWKSILGFDVEKANTQKQVSKTNSSNNEEKEEVYELYETRYYDENKQIKQELYMSKADCKTITYFNNVVIYSGSRYTGNIIYIKNDIANFLKKNINEQNVDSFLEAYGVSCLFDDIFFNSKLNFKQKNEIYNSVLKMANDENRKNLKFKKYKTAIPDGDFSGEFYQGFQGDCAILGRLAAITAKPNGRALLKKHISIDNNYNVTVTFSGLNKKVKVTYDELKGDKYSGFSFGNLNIKAIEIAWDKLTKYIGGVNNPLSNLMFDTALLGVSSTCELRRSSQYKRIPEMVHLLPGPHILTTKYYKKEFNNPDKAFALGFNVVNFALECLGIYLVNERGKKCTFYPMHQYAVKKADDKYVYLIDPHDTGQTLRMKWSDLHKLSFIISEIKLKP